jgi:macrodomain Ter protein organizer (MatP/YcbG family)
MGIIGALVSVDDKWEGSDIISRRRRRERVTREIDRQTDTNKVDKLVSLLVNSFVL